MDFLNPYSISIAVAFFFPTVMLTIILFTVNSKGQKITSCMFLAFLAMTCLPSFLGFAGFFEKYNHYRYLPVTVFSLFGPLLYVTFTSIISVLRLGKCFPLFIPAVIEWFYRLFLFFLPAQVKENWLSTFHHPYVDWWLTSMGCIMAGIAIIKLNTDFKEYIKYLKENSSLLYEVPLRIAKLMFFGVSITASMWIFVEVFELIGGTLSHKQEHPFYLFFIAATFLLFQLIFSAAIISIPIRYSNYSRAVETAPEQINPKLLDDFITKRLFLEPRLSLLQAAAIINCDTEQLTLAVKEGGHNNFNSFVNSYRVEFAKNLLRTSQDEIIQIAFKSGFNSKPTFNRAFKDFTGMSPTEYRESK